MSSRSFFLILNGILAIRFPTSPKRSRRDLLKQCSFDGNGFCIGDTVKGTPPFYRKKQSPRPPSHYQQLTQQQHRPPAIRNSTEAGALQWPQPQLHPRRLRVQRLWPRTSSGWPPRARPLFQQARRSPGPATRSSISPAPGLAAKRKYEHLKSQRVADYYNLTELGGGRPDAEFNLDALLKSDLQAIGEITCPYCLYALPAQEVFDERKWQ